MVDLLTSRKLAHHQMDALKLAVQTPFEPLLSLPPSDIVKPMRVIWRRQFHHCHVSNHGLVYLTFFNLVYWLMKLLTLDILDQIFMHKLIINLPLQGSVFHFFSPGAVLGLICAHLTWVWDLQQTVTSQATAPFSSLPYPTFYWIHIQGGYSLLTWTNRSTISLLCLSVCLSVSVSLSVCLSVSLSLSLSLSLSFYHWILLFYPIIAFARLLKFDPEENRLNPWKTFPTSSNNNFFCKLSFLLAKMFQWDR